MSDSNESKIRNTFRTIDIKDLWKVFLDCVWIMVAAAVTVMLAMFIYIKITYVPMYEATASIYILKTDAEKGVVTSDFQVALVVVDDCTYALKSHAVLDKTIEDLGLDIQYKTLYNRISVSNPKGTRFLKVTALVRTVEEAKQIVDSVCENGIERIQIAMDGKQANIFEYGVKNENPANRTRIRYYLIAGAAAAVLVYIVFLVIFLLDDSIRSDEDITNVLGLIVLGDIPNADDVSGEKGGHGHKYKYGGKYGDRSVTGKAPGSSKTPGGPASSGSGASGGSADGRE